MIVIFAENALNTMRNLSHRREILGPATLPTILSRVNPNLPQPFHTTSLKHNAPRVTWSRIDWTKLRRFSCSKQAVGAVNLTVILLLLWQSISILFWRGDSNLELTLLDMRATSDLPYPLNLSKLATETHMLPSLFQSDPLTNQTLIGPGFAHVRSASFRNKYPSVTMTGTGTMDAIYVISNSRCEKQWQKFENLAVEHSLPVIRWPQVDVRQISLTRPPIPLLSSVSAHGSSSNRAVHGILKRHLAYLDAHRRLWTHIMEHSKQRVLVLDDTVFPMRHLLHDLPVIMTTIDQESVIRHKPWHFVFLRRQPLGAMRSHHVRRSKLVREQVWASDARLGHSIVIANVSHGTSAYVLSLQGARLLREHVTHFRAPLDVEIGLLQRELEDKFVALAPCGEDGITKRCATGIEEVSERKWSSNFDCVWRRMQEVQTANDFAELLRIA